MGNDMMRFFMRKKEQNTGGSATQSINLTNIAAGIYHLVILGDGGVNESKTVLIN
jgi:hypothetical protein